MNLNAAIDIELKAFAGATITDLETGITNGVVDASKGKPMVTQRPSINIGEVATVRRGRAVYFWDNNNLLYLLNNDTIYKTNYSNAIGTTIDAGTERCLFLQLGTLLILLDQQGSKGYTLSAADAVVQIAGAFPAALAHGGAILDGYLFVMDLAGFIWNSDLSVPGTFTAGNFIGTEREEDGGVYLGKHHDHLVALGERTTGFFYDNANASNSPLNRREDLAYTIGCADGHSVWEEGDLTVFLGTALSTGVSVYVLEDFKLNVVSTPGLDSLFTQALTADGYQVLGSGFHSHGHIFYLLTFYVSSGDIMPEVTYVYDLTAKRWYVWRTNIDGLNAFPVIDWSLRAGDNIVTGVGMMANGDYFTANNEFNPQDSIGAQLYVDDDYVEPGYITATGTVGDVFALTIRFGQFDGDNNNNKWMHYLRPRMNKTTNPQTLTFRWADGNNDTFVLGGTIDTQYQFNNLQRCGHFFRRNVELEYAGSEQIFIESLEARIKVGTV